MVYPVPGPRLVVSLRMRLVKTVQAGEGSDSAPDRLVGKGAFVEDEDAKDLRDLKLDYDLPIEESEASVKIETLKAFVKGLFSKDEG